MTTPTADAPITAADYERLPDRRRFDLVAGRLVERHMSLFSGETASKFASILGPYAWDHGLGRVFDAEVGIRIDPSDPEHTRRADVGFVSYSRSPAEDAGYLRVAPELIVEVVSPGDNAQDMRGKVVEMALSWRAHRPGCVSAHTRGPCVRSRGPSTNPDSGR